VIEDDFEHGIVMNTFFRKTHGSPYQPSDPGSKKGIHPGSFGVLLAHPMLCLRQHGCEGLPIVSEEGIDVKVL
jgi:hypothetical protein